MTAQHLQEAEDFILMDAQTSMLFELKSNIKKGNGCRYARLKPVELDSGLWVVGERLTRLNAMTTSTTECCLQQLLPSKHPVTRLLMVRAHRSGHRGRDATLARFRMKYCAPQGSKLARSVKANCQRCKIPEATDGAVARSQTETLTSL